MRRRAIWAAAVAAVVGICGSGMAQTTGVGAAAFLRRGVDARALGMGGAHVAVVDGYSAMYWNPAGLARAQSPQMGGMTAELYGAEIYLNLLSGVVPWELPRSEDEHAGNGDERPAWRLAVGASFTEMATEVRAFDALGNPLGLIRYSESLYSLGAGVWVPNLGLLGGVVKAYSFRAPRAGVGGLDATAFGIGFDAGLALPVWGGLWIGASAADLGDARVQWRNTQLEPVDLVSGRYTGGVAYFVDGLLLEDDRVILAVDVSVEPLVQSQAVRVGAEYTVLFFSLRAGAVVRPDVPVSFTVGAGVHTPRIGIDAAWVQNREIQAEGAGHTLVLSASVSF